MHKVYAQGYIQRRQKKGRNSYKPLRPSIIPEVGLEPTRPRSGDFESPASANSATLASGGVQ